MIADVVFDLPLAHPFSYSVPPGLDVAVGQRVRAPLHGRGRVGVVVGIREGDEAGLKPLERAVEPVPIVSRAFLELTRWAAEESLSSWGSTLASLLPPIPAGRAEPVAPPPEPRPHEALPPELWIDGDRLARLVSELQRAGTALVVAPDVASAERWARRLDAARLDSAAPVTARRAAWFAAARGRARIVVGTRSAVLAPLPPPATTVLIDEHDPAHKPPGAPRMHSRDLLVRRAALDGSRLLLLSATPSVESWWQADQGRFVRPVPKSGPWPEIVTADTRGILRHHPLTLPLTRAIERAARNGGRVALVVSRAGTALICAECGHPLRCPRCGVSLVLSRGARQLRCRLCVHAASLPDRCPRCGGHRLGPLGWDAERVLASVRRRFPGLAASTTDSRAQVVIGAPALLRSLPPGSLDAVGIVALDAVLNAPDFRAGERAFALLWAAAEATGGRGRVIAQTLHPTHYAVEAARGQAWDHFYAAELAFRSELGYPPFRRLCVVSARGRTEAEARALIERCRSAVLGVPDISVYPAAPLTQAAPSTRWQFVIKGPGDLSRRLAEPLGSALARPRRGAAQLAVEMDPI